MAAFSDDIAAWAQPAVVAPLVSPGLSAATAERLMRSPRLAARVSSLLADRLGRAEPGTLAAGDARLALASAETLARIVPCAGAVWHAAQVRALVRAQDVDAFVAALGQEARPAALSWPQLAPPGVATVPADGLEAAIRRAGAACVAAWVDSLPGWAARRLRLGWATGDADLPEPGLRAHAAAIVRAVQP